MSLSENEKLFLRERQKGKDGKEKQKFVSIENKLHEWVKIISPTGTTFNKGAKPFQDFIKIKKHRDALIHFSSTKLENLQSIDFDTVSEAVYTTIEIIKKICEFTADDPDSVDYPFWLKEPNGDGMFNLTFSIKF
jgi:hypothetical protein